MGYLSTFGYMLNNVHILSYHMVKCIISVRCTCVYHVGDDHFVCVLLESILELSS